MVVCWCFAVVSFLTTATTMVVCCCFLFDTNRNNNNNNMIVLCLSLLLTTWYNWCYCCLFVCFCCCFYANIMTVSLLRRENLSCHLNCQCDVNVSHCYQCYFDCQTANRRCSCPTKRLFIVCCWSQEQLQKQWSSLLFLLQQTTIMTNCWSTNHQQSNKVETVKLLVAKQQRLPIVIAVDIISCVVSIIVTGILLTEMFELQSMLVSCHVFNVCLLFFNGLVLLKYFRQHQE